MSAFARLVLALTLIVASPLAAMAQGEDESPWYSTSSEGEAEIHLYFAWSTTCPYCARAKPFVEELDEKYPWLTVHSLNASNPESVELALSVADSIGETIQGVPAFMYCETLLVGYLDEQTTGAQLESDLVACQEARQAELDAASDPPEEPEENESEAIEIPILGTIDPEQVSLPAFTVVMAGLDAFNPCAFFVLLFLLSLLVHARSRGRMAVIGGTFVLISGVLYFAFMVAWLNVFLLFGALPAVTLAAGLIAVVIALVNIKDFFWFEEGPTLSIPDQAKPKLFKRMRGLTESSSFPLMMIGTVTLATVANTYELLCTAGFPLVFTRVLTLNDLPTVTYYSYLVLYNVVYVIPLLAIVGVFVWTLGSRKLTERGGRMLKLASGLMMLGLGLVLIVAPEAMENLVTAPLILLGALGITGVMALIDRRAGSRRDQSEAGRDAERAVG